MDMIPEAKARAGSEIPRAALLEAAARFGTPLYLYDLDRLTDRFDRLHALFGAGFTISYAIKANPNAAVLAQLHHLGVKFDASSIQEVARALATGTAPEDITFTGPVKTEAEIARSVALGIGGLVLETPHQIEMTAAAAQAAGKQQAVLLRISPAQSPKGFGARMTGSATKFGIDEEDAAASVDRVLAHPHLRLVGFHIYSGSNSLQPEAIDENFGIMAEIFTRLADHGGRPIARLIFGAGFGVPYHDTEEPLDIGRLAELIAKRRAGVAAHPLLAQAECTLELGRWLIAPVGWMVSTVIDKKSSRGTEIRLIDAGFNSHMAACGMMGSVLRRNWPITNLSTPGAPTADLILAGPLCTTIDVLARSMAMPDLEIGDRLAVSLSGAYGPTASPIHFISHPAPREATLSGGRIDAAPSVWQGDVTGGALG